MKKRELILDFTSMLDVIMILLFIVISNMSLASVNANAAAKEETAAAQEALAEEQRRAEDAANTSFVLVDNYAATKAWDDVKALFTKYEIDVVEQ